MTIEDVLIDLADRQLRSSSYSKILHVMLNAFLSGDHPVTYEMSGQDILIQIYRLPDAQRQDILNKRLGTIRGSDPYRSVVLVIASVVSLLAVLMALVTVQGIDPHLINEDSQLFSLLFDNASRLLNLTLKELE